MIKRIIEHNFSGLLKSGKVSILLGARRVGKTVLLKNILANIKEPHLYLNGDDITTHELLKRRSVENYRVLLGDVRTLVIDEAQHIPDIGRHLKLMIDEVEGMKILITGSSAFDITNKTGEPLTGRNKTFHLYPLSEQELKHYEGVVTFRENLRHRLVFGNYPEIVTLKSIKEKTEYLRELLNSYLLKDLLVFDTIRNSGKLINLLRLIAFQVGSEVSLQELGNQLNISKNTVERYLDLLTKVFVIQRIEGFSRNLRKEVTKSSKWYFMDNGIRNVLIANLNPLDLRNDHGLLWENYMVSERLKYQSYNGMVVNNFFWRTYDEQELDWVEEREGKLFGYEFKWSAKKVKAPAGWTKAYPDATYQVVDKENYLEWLTR